MKKNIKFWMIWGILLPVMLCTIKDDNGNPVNPGRDTSVPVIEEDVIPSLFVTPDSLYLFPGDTLGIKVRVFADTTLKDSIIKPLILFPVVAKVNKGKIIKDTVLTDSNGRAKILFTDTTAGNVELVVSAGSVSKTVRFEVTNTPVKVQKLFSISTERSVIKADGKDSTIISVSVLNMFRNPISNECVQFITTAGKIRGIRDGENKCGMGSGIGITGSDGVARAILTSSNLNDTAYVTAYLVSDQSLSDEVEVAFQGMTIELNASKNNIKRGDTVIIKAKVVNASGIPVARVPIYFTKEKGNASNLSILSYDSITNYEGVAIVKVSATANGSDAIIVSSCGTVARQQINVTSLRLTLDIKGLPCYTHHEKPLTVEASFKNIEDIPLGGREIKLIKYFKTENKKDTTEELYGKTDHQGKCQFSISVLPWESPMRIHAIGYDMEEGTASADTTFWILIKRDIEIYAPSYLPADGRSKEIITVFVKDTKGNPIVGDIVRFTTTAGMIIGKDTTDMFGKAETYIFSSRENTRAKVIVSLDNYDLKDSTIVIFYGVNVSVTPKMISLLGVSEDEKGNIKKDSVGPIIITVKDAAGIPISGVPVDVGKNTKNGRKILKKFISDSVTDNRGEVRVMFYDAFGIGRDTIEVSSCGDTQFVIINLTENILNISIDTSKNIHCNFLDSNKTYYSCLVDNNTDKDSTIIDITYLRARDGLKISDADLKIAVTVGVIDTIFFITTLRTNAEGKATVKIKNPEFTGIATVYVEAKKGNDVTLGSSKIYFTSPRVKYMRISATPSVIGVHKGEAKIEVIAYDSIFNRVEGATVAFNLLSGPGGGEYLRPAVSITGRDGKATSILYAGNIPSYFNEVWICAETPEGVRSDTAKLTIAGPPHYIKLSPNILKGKNPNDGTFILPCAAIVTDVNGNPVVDGTEVNFSVQVSGYVIYRKVGFVVKEIVNGLLSCTTSIYEVPHVLPFEDFDNNFDENQKDEDRNKDGVVSRGENLNGDRDPFTGKDKWEPGPLFEDINNDGKRQCFYPLGEYAEPWDSCPGGMYKPIDFNNNNRWDPVEPFIIPPRSNNSMYDILYEEYNSIYNELKVENIFWKLFVIKDLTNLTKERIEDIMVKIKRLTEIDSIYYSRGPYDIDWKRNGVCDPKTAVAITRTTKTEGGKALNEIIYGQSDANHIEVMIWAESQGIVSNPEKFILPLIGD